MSVELEAKYKINREVTLAFTMEDPEVKPYTEFDSVVLIDATYYDTATGDLAKKGACLRFRMEEDQGVCCLKTKEQTENGIFRRDEFQCNAKTVAEGIRGLKETDAPKELLDLIESNDLVDTCRMQFTRHIWNYDRDGLKIEFVADKGTAFGEKGKLLINELELEKKAGADEAFFAFCTGLAKRQYLLPEEMSKLARYQAL